LVDNWHAVFKAADAAARWHIHQRRKGLAQEPYINHLLEVASLVAEATRARDSNVIIAALLHDAIEDQNVSREMIADSWGEPVAKLVEEVTDDKRQPKDVRKLLQIERAASTSDQATLIKIADKTSNLRGIASSPPDWSGKRRLAYVAWSREVVQNLRGVNAWLEAEFDRAAEAADKSLQG
jgi:(p)ppGpp synthase/HD superfamily hydrolase